VPQTATYSIPATRHQVAPSREVIWIEEPRFLGWGCSECAWLFKPSGAPVGDSLEEMKENFLCLRDEEFAAHMCAEHPRAKKVGIQIVRAAVQSSHRIPPRGKWGLSGSRAMGRRAEASGNPMPDKRRYRPSAI
jgi:hypothetical protein